MNRYSGFRNLSGGPGRRSAPRYSEEAPRADLDAPYQLASGDRLSVIVFGQEGLTNSFSVDGAATSPCR